MPYVLDAVHIITLPAVIWQVSCSAPCSTDAHQNDALSAVSENERGYVVPISNMDGTGGSVQDGISQCIPQGYQWQHVSFVKLREVQIVSAELYDWLARFDRFDTSRIALSIRFKSQSIVQRVAT
ncbi:hypothetical protein DBV15_02314 [Temnothorax longispinosus]|uniref:Uncharacterized protein n=1 Tax=Temnothorax longispinosus TaxID=300112 RepID=A0A4V3SCP5_9HYME|nr:hypothetical protein DBV15_02314 [Temnothorax longispinosus]